MSRRMKDSGIEWIGEIPEDWEVGKVKYYTEVIMGQSPKSEEYNQNGEGIPFLQGNADFTCLHPVANTFTRSANKYAQEFDVLLSVRAPVGAKNIADREYAIGRGLCALRPRKIDKDYLWHIVDLMNEGFSTKSRGSTFESVTISDVRDSIITLPQIQYQQKIAYFLDKKVAEIDHILEKTRESIEEYKKYKQSIITEAVIKGLNPDVKMKDSGIEWIGEIPEHWNIVKISRLTYSYSGGTPSRDEISYWQDGTINWMSSGEVNNEYIYETNEKITELGLQNSSAKFFPENTVVVALNGQGKTKGMSAILKIKTTVNQSLVGFICDSKKLDFEFLHYCLKASYHFNRSYIAGGNKRDGIAANELKMQRIPLPPMNEQVDIINKIKSKISIVDDLLIQKDRLISDLEAYKKSLIYECVTGKREVV